jgi:hypothetical protein
VKRRHEADSATLRPTRQLMFLTRRFLLCTAVSPGPRGGAHLWTAAVDPAVPEPQATATPTNASDTMTEHRRARIVSFPLFAAIPMTPRSSVLSTSS